MKFIETTKTNKNSLLFVSLKLIFPAMFIGLLFTLYSNNHKQYSPGFISAKEDDKDDNGSMGMQEYFFNARKDISTNTMNFPSMLAATAADRAMISSRKTHKTTALPDFSWISMGPNNIGGRTRAILIDNTDPSHQTLFAGGITGGIWKSTNGGGTWGNTNATIAFSQDDNLSNMNVCCIAQDANGAIYIGTGEGVTEGTGYFVPGLDASSGELGGGIFKSTDDGVTWTVLSSTVPSSNNISTRWAYVNRLAIRPDNSQVIYAATNDGLYVSHDAGTTWNKAVNSNSSVPITGVTPDVKISDDGSLLVACIGGVGYYCYPQTNPDNAFTPFNSSGLGRLPSFASRIEFAIAPSDPNRVYASVIDGSELFGPGSSNSGVYMNMTTKSNGGYWYEIGPGGSYSYDPYIAPGSTQDQADYDNALGVAPANEGLLWAGGTVWWEWKQININDTVGSWTKVSYYYDAPAYHLYMHPDQHTIVFDRNNPNLAYFGNDGGVYRCTNVLDSAQNANFDALNRNYDVTQYYTLCYSPHVNYDVVNYADSTVNEGIGIGGGTQDNGSPYVSGNSGLFPNDGVDMSSGDGSGTAISFLNPNVAYFTTDFGTLIRTSDLGAYAQPTLAYTSTIGDSLGANIDSVEQAAYNHSPSEVCFVLPVALYENPYDTLNHDSIKFIAARKYPIDSTIWLTDPNGPTSYPYVLPDSLQAGDTIMVPDRVVSRLAVGFCPAQGVWVNCQGASNGTVSWMPIAFGSYSTPDAYTGTTPISCLAWSPDGDALFAGSQDGTLFRFSNLNTIIANKYSSGALWYQEQGVHRITTQVISTKLTFAAIAGRDMLSIAVDPQDGNNVLITLGNYNSSAYVYYSHNALDTSPTFAAVQGNLPAMPVYGSLLDVRNSDGSWSTNSAMIATEHGIYTTDNINVPSPTWVKSTNGLPNVITTAVMQQTHANWQCNNSGDIYVATHGRGLWASTNNYQAPTYVPSLSSSVKSDNLLIYPDPASSQSNIEFNLATTDNVTIIIYDMQGKEMKTIKMGTQSPGTHIVPFETNFAAGTYFASLTGNNFKKVSKFVVVK